MSEGTASAGSLLLLADVSLPHGATLSSIACTFQDDSAVEYVNGAKFVLFRRGITTEQPENYLTDGMATGTLTTAAATVNASPVANTWADSAFLPAGAEVVDNASYDYFMYVSWAVSNDTTSALRFYGCRIAYTLQNVAY
jgi:Tfp pilus assembly protein PilV